MTIFIEGMEGNSLSQELLDDGGDVFRSKAELFEEILERGGCTEGVHADGFAFWAHVAFPAEGGSHFDGDSRGDGGGQNTFLVRVILAIEEFPRRHADDADVDALGGELLLGCEAQGEFRAGADEDGFGPGIGRVRENVSASGDAGSGSELAAIESGHGLARENHRRRAMRVL